MSLTIVRGERIGIVGATGAGKSTLVNLIMGLLEPTAGEIRIDGTRLAGLEALWQRGIGFVAPVSYLINDSVRRNIAFGFGDEEIDLRRLASVVEVSQLGDVLDAMDDGLDALVGERGAKISAGERQRIGIARALYRRPHLLVLDEALSALDARTEARVLAGVDSWLGDCTRIVVTHRACTLRECDRLALLHDGRLLATGHFDALLESNDHFRRLLANTEDSAVEV